VLILLPPSETKAAGGDTEQLLAWQQLSFADELTSTRRAVANALVELVRGDELVAMAALGVSERQRHELDTNAGIGASGTLPALLRYTGVLYDAFDIGSLRAPERRRAYERVAIGSALFGLVRAGDAIPAYRLSGGSRLPQLDGTIAAVWKSQLSALLHRIAGEELVVDLRSGTYRALGTTASAITAQVFTEAADGSRSVVSHFNKHTKGLLARALVRTSGEPQSVKDVARVARRAGLRVEVVSDTQLDIITTDTPAARATRATARS
jgi:cytoplasmic iron level regulating protein YaaA (DUF328/UPF0246 family)